MVRRSIARSCYDEDGRRQHLENNYVRWDIEKERFSANGVYVLNRGGIKTKGMGKNICVDARLNRVRVQNAEVERKAKQECFAKQ